MPLVSIITINYNQAEITRHPNPIQQQLIASEKTLTHAGRTATQPTPQRLVLQAFSVRNAATISPAT